MAFAAYLQENAILVLSRGGAFTYLFKPHRERFAVFAAFPKKIAYKRIKGTGSRFSACLLIKMLFFYWEMLYRL